MQSPHRRAPCLVQELNSGPSCCVARLLTMCCSICRINILLAFVKSWVDTGKQSSYQTKIVTQFWAIETFPQIHLFIVLWLQLNCEKSAERGWAGKEEDGKFPRRAVPGGGTIRRWSSQTLTPNVLARHDNPRLFQGRRTDRQTLLMADFSWIIYHLL